MNSPRTPPRFVPTLTEVVEFAEAVTPMHDEAALVLSEPMPMVVADDGGAPDDAANAPVMPWQTPVPDAPGQAAWQPDPVALAEAPGPVVVAVDRELTPGAGGAIATEDVPAFLLAPQSLVQPAPAHQAEAWAGSVATAGAAAEVVPADVEQGPEHGAELGAEQQEQIVHNVLTELQRRTDLMLEYRLRETLTPILARLCDALIKDAREDLATTLRDVVTRAVTQELTRHRPK
jgi:hypothetical protein